MFDRAARIARLASAATALAGLVAPLAGAVSGTVVNATTGQPAPNVLLTLSSFRGGMTPVDEAVSGADGSFEFAKDLPSVAEGQPFAGAIRAELDGVFYTEILSSTSSLDDVRITVYSASGSDLPPPSRRIVVLEPEGSQVNVMEIYVFRNDSFPAVTYSSEAGTLRFYLPDEARGSAEVSGRGPAGMPLTSSALPAGEEGLHKVDFPLKPGESQITVGYSHSRANDGNYTLRAYYDGVDTRVGVPSGVSVEGEGVRFLSEEPTTQASVYAVAAAGTVELTIAGEGRLPQGPSSESARSPEISIEPAPIAKELAWIAAISVLILGIGFFHLLKSSPRPARASSPGERG